MEPPPADRVNYRLFFFSFYLLFTCILAMYPNTLKMTKPATKLVTQLMVL